MVQPKSQKQVVNGVRKLRSKKRNLNKLEKERLNTALLELYDSAQHDRVEFYHQDRNGVPIGPVENTTGQTTYKPTLLDRHIMDPETWKGETKPPRFTGKWPPTSEDQLLGRVHRKECCTNCGTETEKCECSYDDWVADMHDQWIGTVLIKLTPDRGYGLFARTTMPVGEVLGEYCGKLIPQKENRSKKDSEYCTSIAIGTDLATAKKKASEQPVATIDGKYEGSVFRFMNHSCEPNAALMYGRIGMDQRCLFVDVIQEIETGEEITIDYGVDYFSGRDYCRCKSANCKYSREALRKQ